MARMRVLTRLRLLLAMVAGLMATGCGMYTPVAPPHASLIAPASPAAPAALLGLYHTVQPGETLYGLGQRYGVPYRAIMRASGLTSTTIAAGQRLLIPTPEAMEILQPGPAAGAPRLPSIHVPLYSNTRWTHIVIHHSATTSGNARTLDRAHRRRGFSNGLGYHFLINNGTLGRRDGQIEVGPRWIRQAKGAHCDAGKMNEHGIGICLVGNFMTHEPSPAQLASLEALIAKLQAYYRIPDERVIRHKDVIGKSTACPGRQFPWSRIRSDLRQLPP